MTILFALPLMLAGTPALDAQRPVGHRNEAEDRADAARLLTRYHALIAARRYRDAYRLWRPGAAGQSAGAFAAGFARYASYHAVVGRPGRVDPGAGQRYVTVPIRVSGRLTQGGGFALSGTFVLHRTAAIDGATAEQRSWRIQSSTLRTRSRG